MPLHKLIDTTWDGVYLSKEGILACKVPDITLLELLNFEGQNHPTLEGWDIPSFVVTNPSILKMIEKKENTRHVEL